MITLEIKGQVLGGKNQQLISCKGAYPRKYPSEKFKEYRYSFWIQALAQKTKLKLTHGVPLKAMIEVFQGDKRRRDVPGMMDCIWHCLEYAEIIDNDYWIRQVDWSEKIDKANPRVCIVLKTMGEK